MLARTVRKSTVNRSERASRTSRATDRFRKPLFSSSGASKWSPRSSRGVPLGVLLGGRSCALFGRSWALLGRSWSALGALLGAPGMLLGAPGALLGRSLTSLGDLGSILAPPRVDFGASGGRFRSLPGSILSGRNDDATPTTRERRERINNNDTTTTQVGRNDQATPTTWDRR